MAQSTLVVISSTDVEIVVASETSREQIWLKRLQEEVLDIECKPVLMIDNEPAIRLAQNLEF